MVYISHLLSCKLYVNSAWLYLSISLIPRLTPFFTRRFFIDNYTQKYYCQWKLKSGKQGRYGNEVISLSLALVQAVHLCQFRLVISLSHLLWCKLHVVSVYVDSVCSYLSHFLLRKLCIYVMIGTTTGTIWEYPPWWPVWG